MSEEEPQPIPAAKKPPEWNFYDATQHCTRTALRVENANDNADDKAGDKADDKAT